MSLFFEVIHFCHVWLFTKVMYYNNKSSHVCSKFKKIYSKVASCTENKSYISCWAIKRILSDAITYVDFEMITVSKQIAWSLKYYL